MVIQFMPFPASASYGLWQIYKKRVDNKPTLSTEKYTEIKNLHLHPVFQGRLP